MPYEQNDDVPRAPETRGRTDEADLTNDQFRLLAQRSFLLDDRSATDELTRYFILKARKKVMTFPPEVRDRVMDDLLESAFKATRATFGKVVGHGKHRNYVMRAMTNRYVDLLRKKAAPQEERVVAFHSFEDHAMNRDLLIRFLEESREFGTPGQLKVAQVIVLVYLLDISERHACKILDFGPTETESVLKRLRRWRKNPNSPLWKFMRRHGEAEGSND